MSEEPIESAPLPVAGRPAGPIVWECVQEAFWSALLVWIFGGIALSIAGAFAGNMVPAPPPFLRETFAGDGHHPASATAWWSVVKGYAFAGFFVIFLLHSVGVAYFGRHKSTVGGCPEGRLARALRNLRENWFEIIIGNAIGAWVIAVIVAALPSFSLWSIFGKMVVDWLPPLPAGWAGSRELLNWYWQNQQKLSFWLLYLAGAFDDLGVPNLKTWVRWAWRRWRRRGQVKPTTPQLTTDQTGTFA